MADQSPDGTVVTTGSIVDASGNIWTLVRSRTNGYQIAKNGVVDTTTANVTKLVYANGLVYQQNKAGGWWYWQNGWVASSAPVINPPSPTPSPGPGPTPTPGPTPAPTPGPSPGGVGPSASSGFITVNCQAKTGNTVQRTLWGSSMASDVDFTPWNDSGVQNVARNEAGFGLPGMYARINSNDTTMDSSGNPDMTFISRVSQSIGKIIDLGTGSFSYNLGGRGASPSQFAAGAVKTARQFMANGTPCKGFEIFNEHDDLDIGTYSAIFNAAADALHGVDPTIQVIGTNDSWMNGGRMAGLANNCGGRVARFHYHSYSVDPSVSDGDCMSRAISRFGGDASGLRSSLRGTPCGSTPAGIGEYNMDGGPPGDPRQLKVQGAVFNLLGLYTAFTADPLTTHGAIWDWLGDGYYGMIIHQANNPAGLPPGTVAPVGYALKNCRQYMFGNTVSVNVPNGNLRVLATVNGNAASVLMINFDGGQSFSGQVALSQWPVNSTGNGSVVMHQVSNATPRSSANSISVSNGVTSSINLPPMSVSVLTSIG
jgi:hypothetical protein